MNTAKLNSQYDIVVIGGGLVGASFVHAALRAAGLANRSLLLVEAGEMTDTLREDAADVRATALSHGSRGIYERLGLWEHIAPDATAIREIRVSDRGRIGGTRLSAAEQGVEALGYVVENRKLIRILHAGLLAARDGRADAPSTMALAEPATLPDGGQGQSGTAPFAMALTAASPVTLTGGGQERLSAASSTMALTLAAPATLEMVRAVPGGMALVIRNGGREQRLKTRLLVLADGGSSPACRQLGIGQRRHDYDQHALIATIAFERPHRNIAFELFTASGPLAVLPLPDRGRSHRGSLVWTLASAEAARYATLTEADLIPRLQVRFGRRLGAITAMAPWHCHPLALSVATEQVRPGLALLGNVAHTLHPVAGQGLNLALRDADSLVAALAATAVAGGDIGAMVCLRSYVDGQRRDQGRTISLTDGLARWFSSGDIAKVLLRQGGLLALDALPRARRHFAAVAMGELREG